MSEQISYKALKELAVITKGRQPKGEQKSVPYLTAAVLRGKEKAQLVDPSKCVSVGSGDPIVLWDGAGAGDLFRGQDGILASTMAKVALTDNTVSKDFLFYFLSSQKDVIKASSSGTTVPHVNGGDLKELQVPLLPLAEQERIVKIMQGMDDYITTLSIEIESQLSAEMALVGGLIEVNAGGESVELGTLLKLDVRSVSVADNMMLAGVRDKFGGLFDKGDLSMRGMKYTKMHRLKADTLVISKIRAVGGGMAIVGKEFEDYVMSPEFPTYSTSSADISLEYIMNWLTSHSGRNQLAQLAAGMGGGKVRITPTNFLKMKISLPSLDTQESINIQIKMAKELRAGSQAELKEAQDLRGQLLSSLIETAENV